jgi:hypothetical protein
MSYNIISFPPGAGGNHLKNLIDNALLGKEIDSLYKKNKTVHSNIGSNFNAKDLLEHKLTLGHFGEIMSNQKIIRSLSPVKFIILSPDTLEDRVLLSKRRRQLGHHEDYYSTLGNYFDGEQVFLYESFIYHYYFNIPLENTINISISDFFNEDIKPELKKISEFLEINFDYDQSNLLHKTWRSNNNIVVTCKCTQQVKEDKEE